ncbi:hypothetical protein TRICHSKD4_4301 [Roseibium sp. TrichSKD4]|nr:hypothetical protein TRICHSKD4_4301 [Roseibium sp. TrichSKD4]
MRGPLSLQGVPATCLEKAYNKKGPAESIQQGQITTWMSVLELVQAVLLARAARARTI